MILQAHSSTINAITTWNLLCLWKGWIAKVSQSSGV